MLEIATEARPGAVVVAPAGRIDAASASVFESACLEQAKAGAKVMVLDFCRVQYISSAGLRGVLLIGKTLQNQGGALRLANLGGIVAQVFELSGFTGLFPVYDSVASATE